LESNRASARLTHSCSMPGGLPYQASTGSIDSTISADSLPPGMSSALMAGAACAGWSAPGVALRLTALPDAPHQPCTTSPTQHSAAAGTAPTSSQQPAVISVPYQEGLIWTRGAHAMSGYWQDPEATQQVHDSFLIRVRRQLSSI
jgi:acyl-CoA synthetase (AMP-forming)/AMP-acid ligase II